MFYEFYEKFGKIKAQGVNVVINWHYHPEDDDLLEEGQIMAEALGLDFNFHPTNGEEESVDELDN